MKSETPKARLHRLEAAEILLIRVGQHLFREWRAKGRKDNDLEASFLKVWQLKRQIREAKRELRTKSSHKPIAGVPGHAERPL